MHSTHCVDGIIGENVLIGDHHIDCNWCVSCNNVILHGSIKNCLTHFTPYSQRIQHRNAYWKMSSVTIIRIFCEQTLPYRMHKYTHIHTHVPQQDREIKIISRLTMLTLLLIHGIFSHLVSQLILWTKCECKTVSLNYIMNWLKMRFIWRV